MGGKPKFAIRPHRYWTDGYVVCQTCDYEQKKGKPRALAAKHHDATGHAVFYSITQQGIYGEE